MTESGLELERKAHQFLTEKGYFVIHGLNLFNIEYKENFWSKYDELTDVDILGIYYDQLLNKHSCVIDCKTSLGSLSKQILSNIGIREILKPNVLLMIRPPPIRLSLRNLANENKIKIFPPQFFEEIAGNPTMGSYSQESYKKIESLFDNKEKDKEKSKLVTEIYFPLQNTFRIGDLYKRLTKAILIFSKLKEIKVGAKNTEFWNYLCLLSFQYIFLFMIDIASDVIDCPPKELKKFMLYNLNPEYDFKIKMVNLLNQATEEKIDKKEMVKIEDISPTNSEEIITATRNIIQLKAFIQKQLLFNDLIIYEYILPNKKIDLFKIKEVLKLSNSDFKIFGTINKNIIEAMTFKENIPSLLLNLTE